jgi:hypothetical protein
MFFILAEAADGFGIALLIFGFEGGQIEQRILFLLLFEDPLAGQAAAAIGPSMMGVGQRRALHRLNQSSIAGNYATIFGKPLSDCSARPRCQRMAVKQSDVRLRSVKRAPVASAHGPRDHDSFGLRSSSRSMSSSNKQGASWGLPGNGP